MPLRRGATRLRVVSLVPAATEIIAALGEADCLAGVSHECTLGDGRAERPRVTASALGRFDSPGTISTQVSTMAASGAPLFTLLGDEIAALRPDVIITQGLCSVCAVSEEDVRALAARLAPTPRVVSISASTLDGVFTDIAAIAAELHALAASDRLLASLRSRMKRVHGVLSDARAPRPRVAVLEWTDPLYAAGHWVPELVYRAGGTDVLAVAGRHSREVTADALVDAEPAIVLVSPCGYDIERSALEGRQLVNRDPSIRERTVWALDARSLVSQPGPGLVDGIETMAAIFNPALFDAPEPSHAIRLTAS